MEGSHWNQEYDMAKAYASAEAIMQDKAKSFYQAFSHLPPERFQAIQAIYAFCRHADDVVDQENTSLIHAKENLQKCREDLEFFYETRSLSNRAKTFVWYPAFAKTIEDYSIPIEAFLMQLDGQESDLIFEDLVTLDDLIQYSILVAGSVGLMLMPILLDKAEDQANLSIQKACIDLGIGMQITNILRDVGEDIRTRNRVYIPSNVLDSYEITRDELLYWSKEREDFTPPKKFQMLWEELAKIADQYYQEINAQLQYFHKDVRFPLLASTYVYQSIENAVRKSKYNCLSKRNYTSRLERNLQVARAKKDLLLMARGTKDEA